MEYDNEILKLKAAAISSLGNSIEHIISETEVLSKEKGYLDALKDIEYDLDEMQSYSGKLYLSSNSKIVKRVISNVTKEISFDEAKRFCNLSGFKMLTYGEVYNLGLKYRFNTSSSGWEYNHRTSVPGPDSYYHYYWDYLKLPLPIWIDDEETESEATLIDFDVDEEVKTKPSNYYSLNIKLVKKKVLKKEKYKVFFHK